jgi:YrbI family 3-deoxy-D-manno-octulosonate 8-phosphate phosphatase
MDMKKEKILAIIPARGGSKGIPRKNVQLVAGKPLIHYSIEHARRTQEISRIIVSTDDPEIGAVARGDGAEVISRPAEISGDESPSELALTHVLETLREKEEYHPDLVVFLQATSPLRQPWDIERAIATLRQAGADSLFSACPAHAFLWRREPSGLRSFNYDFRRRPRRQEAPEDFLENGSIYVFKPWVLEQTGNRLGGKIAIYLMNALDSLQVDGKEELSLIGQILLQRMGAGRKAPRDRVKLLILDFDGVMTDNRVLVSQDGRESVWCHRADGWGIEKLTAAGVGVVVVSTEKNPVVMARCVKLGIRCFQGCGDKLSVLKSMLEENRVDPKEVVYVGNDVNDLACMEWVGTAVAPADAHLQVQKVASWVATHLGGQGVVREVADWILQEERGNIAR